MMICERCGNPVEDCTLYDVNGTYKIIASVDSTCACPSIVPDLKAELAKLREENSALKLRLDQEHGAYIVCNYPHQPGCICGRTIAEQRNKLDAWGRYHQLLREELDGAVGMAWIHGWRSTPENIERGVKLRVELGLKERNG